MYPSSDRLRSCSFPHRRYGILGNSLCRYSAHLAWWENQGTPTRGTLSGASSCRQAYIGRPRGASSAERTVRYGAWQHPRLSVRPQPTLVLDIYASLCPPWGARTTSSGGNRGITLTT